MPMPFPALLVASAVAVAARTALRAAFTEAAASAFLSKLKREKIDAFLWTSPAGQVVDPLAAR